MGIIIEVTNVNKEGNFISYTQDGQSKTAGICEPAQIKWAKVGKAEVGFNPEGKINFVKSLEPKAKQAWSNAPKKREYNAINSVEVVQGINLDEFKVIYNEMSAKPNTKVNATNYLNHREKDGKFIFDAVLFYTRFEKISEENKELMGNGEQAI